MSLYPGIRTLSTPEWLAFQADMDPNLLLDLPPWGAIAFWNGMYILVFQGPSGELFLTDITAVKDQIPVAPEWQYNNLQTWAIWRYTQAVATDIGNKINALGSAGDTLLNNLGWIATAAIAFLVWKEIR